MCSHRYLTISHPIHFAIILARTRSGCQKKCLINKLLCRKINKRDLWWIFFRWLLHLDIASFSSHTHSLRHSTILYALMAYSRDLACWFTWDASVKREEDEQNRNRFHGIKFGETVQEITPPSSQQNHFPPQKLPVEVWFLEATEILHARMYTVVHSEKSMFE